MQKIPTIFEREGRSLTETLSPFVDRKALASSTPTEKLDGMNVRITVRSEMMVRLEARANPNKNRKKAGIIEPWYRDVWLLDRDQQVEAADQYLMEAAYNTVLWDVPDGEWPGEVVGPKVQGNPLELERHTTVLFSVPAVREKLAFPEVPVFPLNGELSALDRLRAWLEDADSVYSPGHRIEGVVFWHDGVPVGKIKLRDFRS